MGAESAVKTGDVRWLTPLPLWAGILAGPIAWAFNLTTNYALVTWVCQTNHDSVLLLISIVSLAIATGGAALSWAALTRTTDDLPTDGGRPRQRARFMAVLGLTASALFALQIIAGAIPHRVLDACR